MSSGGSKTNLESDAAGDDSSTPSMAMLRIFHVRGPSSKSLLQCLAEGLVTRKEQRAVGVSMMMLPWQLLKDTIHGLGASLPNRLRN